VDLFIARDIEAIRSQQEKLRLEEEAHKEDAPKDQPAKDAGKTVVEEVDWS
jgi:hypothetical protein